MPGSGIQRLTGVRSIHGATRASVSRLRAGVGGRGLAGGGSVMVSPGGRVEPSVGPAPVVAEGPRRVGGLTS